MAKPKRKLLPKDFEQLLAAGDMSALLAVFEGCDVNARGGVTKQTALAFNECPDDLARWLGANGADLAAPDNYGETPLHSRARHWQGRIGVLLELGADVSASDSRGNTPLFGAARVGHVQNARLLIEHGADPNARNRAGLTPLEETLQRCSNIDIVRTARIAELLLPLAPKPTPGLLALAGRLFAGGGRQESPVTPQMKAAVKRIGEQFEFYRAGFNPEAVDETSASLDRLYALFDVEPVARRVMHDGMAPIPAVSGPWQDRHQALWELLVPSQGAAATIQGEVIRISGKIAHELDGNGGINWDREYSAMADAFVAHVASGTPLDGEELAFASALAAQAKRREGDIGDLCRLAVQWVERNAKPVALPVPPYSR